MIPLSMCREWGTQMGEPNWDVECGAFTQSDTYPVPPPAPCRSRVKFWLIKNYMSPQHRATLPDLASKFGFTMLQVLGRPFLLQFAAHRAPTLRSATTTRRWTSSASGREASDGTTCR